MSETLPKTLRDMQAKETQQNVALRVELARAQVRLTFLEQSREAAWKLAEYWAAEAGYWKGLAAGHELKDARLGAVTGRWDSTVKHEQNTPKERTDYAQQSIRAAEYARVQNWPGDNDPLD